MNVDILKMPHMRLEEQSTGARRYQDMEGGSVQVSGGAPSQVCCLGGLRPLFHTPLLLCLFSESIKMRQKAKEQNEAYIRRRNHQHVYLIANAPPRLRHRACARVRAGTLDTAPACGGNVVSFGSGVDLRLEVWASVHRLFQTR